MLLTVGIPAHNEAASLPACLDALVEAIDALGRDVGVEIVVIDDGSDDGTHAIAQAHLPPGLGTVVRQENRGRAVSRYRLAQAAQGHYVLMVDAHVRIGTEALAYWSRMRTHEGAERQMWNGDVSIVLNSPYAHFWDLVTTVGWRRYFMNRTLTGYGSDDFDSYPKGAGMLLAPRDLWLLGYADSRILDHENPARISDDTRLIRAMAAHERIWLSPGFCGDYVSPRTTLLPFVRNAAYRGATFVDSYWDASSHLASLVRLLPAVGTAAAAALLIGAFQRPRVAATVAAGCVATPGVLAWVTASAIGKPVAYANRVAAIAPLFSVAFGSGLVLGYVGRLRSHRSIRSSEA